MPLRLRLTFVYAALLAASLAGLSLAIYVIADSRLSGDVDDDLSLKADSVVVSLEPVDSPLTIQGLTTNQLLRLGDEASAGILFQVRDTEGSVIYSSFQPGARNLPLPPDPREPAASSYYSTKIRDESFRVLYQPVTQDGEFLGAIVVGASLSSTTNALDLIRNVLIGGGITVLLLSTAPAYYLAGRVLRPVRRVSALARDIEHSADFSRRVPVTPAGDELSELARTFNSMIARVERVLESQRAFLADSSHELRRPLTVLRTDLGVICEPGISDQERQVVLQEMKRQAELMTRVISDLLLLSREGREEILAEPFDYSALCEDAVGRAQSRDAGRHNISSSITPGVRIIGDGERLGRVLDNLLENATEYTPEGGDIVMTLALSNGSGRVTVSDTGAGISEKDLPHIFERFYRVESARARSSEHSGLGLAIAKHIVEAHGGSIAVVSQVGSGTTFTVDLPLLPGS